MSTATIKDVAKAAQVSPATVSRAMNGHSAVSDSARQRILEVAAALRYVPHSGARSLITRRTQTIGVLLPDLYGEFFSELIRGIDLAARRDGFHILVSSSHGDAQEASAALGTMRGRVDGLLVMSAHVDRALLRETLPASLPVVLINTPVQGQDYPQLAVDNYRGAYAMVRHLVDRGFRAIALIAGPAPNHDAQERERGYRDALAALLPEATAQVLRGDFTEESGYRAGQRIARMSNRPDAVFASNDTMALGCLFALSEAGVNVPRDIALTGFDDIPIARFVSPPLTTVRVRIAELGQQALEQLLALLDTHATDFTPQVLPAELVVRGSCERSTTSAAGTVAQPHMAEPGR